MKFVLPLPPSINNTYGVSRRGTQALYKREVVKEWEGKAGWIIKRQLLKMGSEKKLLPYKGKIRMEIGWFFLRNRDIDSGIKVLLDIFEDYKIYANDQQVIKINMKKEFDSKDPRVEVEIELC